MGHYEHLISDNERLRGLLRLARPFVNDAGDDEDPDAKAVASELIARIDNALAD